jgi:hypothetical protein
LKQPLPPLAAASDVAATLTLVFVIAHLDVLRCRDIDDVEAEAKKHGLALAETVRLEPTAHATRRRACVTARLLSDSRAYMSGCTKLMGSGQAERSSTELNAQVDMPANNFLLVFEKEE